VVQEPEEEASFINVDLDVQAPYDLGPLVRALGQQVTDLHTCAVDGQFQSHLEIALREDMPSDADSTIQEFVRLLAQLPPAEKQLWNGATERDFNIGIQAGTKPHAFVFALSAQTLASAVELGARVVVTTYAVDFKYLERQQRRRTRR
jgi:hypothetical protein